jgi:N-acetylmuramoyl-L-alanine amidase
MKKSKFFIGFLFIVVMNNFVNAQMINKIKVALDASGGGKDMGVVNKQSNLITKNVNMEVCKMVAGILDKTNDIEVVYTRNDDEYVELSERAFIAAENQVNLFFSIECYSEKKESNGLNIWVLNDTDDLNNMNFSKKSNIQIKKENGYNIVYKDFDFKNPNNILENTKLDKNYINKSLDIANKFINNVQSEKGIVINSKINNGYLLLLHYVGVPSLKAQIGNINNEIDVINLNDYNYKLKIATALANTIIEYKKQYLDYKFDPNINTINKDLISKININDVFKSTHSDVLFDFGIATLKEDNYLELDKIALFLLKYNNLNLEIRCHTDSRSSEEFNLHLSQKRANVIHDYIVKKGVSKDRIVAKGLGEYYLINKCTNDVICTEEEHLENRRSEFILIEK